MSDERRRRQTQRMVDEAVVKGTKKSWWQRSWAVFLTLVSLAGAFVAFYPRPTLVSSDNRDPDKLFKLMVTLGNNNVVPLEDVRVYLKITSLRTTTGTILNDASFFQGKAWSSDRLGADDRFDIDLTELIRIEAGLIAKADLTVTVHYQPWFIPWDRTKEFLFRAQKLTDGTIRLMAVPAG